MLDAEELLGEAAVMWNPQNKVVQNYRSGEIIQPDTDRERAKRGFPPFNPKRAAYEARQPPAY